MNWHFFLAEHICLSRWMWNLPLVIVLTTSSLHWSVVLGTQYASTVVFLCSDVPLSVVTFFFFGHARPNSRRHGQEQPIFVLFFVNDKSASYFTDSCLVNHILYSISPLPVILPSVCCCLGSHACARTCSRSYASAACWWCQCMSSCTGVGAVSTRRGRRLPCCKLSTWRQFPSGGW